jgi:hypothetical protein
MLILVDNDKPTASADLGLIAKSAAGGPALLLFHAAGAGVGR